MVQHNLLGSKTGSEGIEEPSMRVDLLLILLFHTEDNLYRDMLRWVRWLQLVPRVDPNWRSALHPQSEKRKSSR